MGISYVSGSGASVTNNGSVTTQTLQVGTGLSAGNLIVVGVWSGANTSVTFTVTDNNSNTYTQDKFQALATDGDSTAVWHADDISVSPNVQPTITVGTSGASGSIRIVLAAYSGTATSSFDKSASANATSAGPASGNVTPSVNNELLVGITANAGTVLQTISAGSGFTLRTSTNDGANHDRMALEDLVQGTLSTAQSTFGYTNSEEWTCFVTTYEPAPIPVSQIVGPNDIAQNVLVIPHLIVAGY